MQDAPRQALREVIQKYGPALSEDRRRLEGLLRDYAGAYRREITVLVAAADEGVPRELLDSQAGVPVELRVPRLVQRLEDNRAISHEAASWAVESWAEALGVGGVSVAPGGAMIGAKPEGIAPTVVMQSPVPAERASARAATSAPASAPAQRALPTTTIALGIGGALLIGVIAIFFVFRTVASSSNGGTSPSGTTRPATPLAGGGDATPTPVDVAVASEAPPSEPPDEAEAAPTPEVRVGVVPPAAGRIRVNSSPSGAAISLNGSPAGQAPTVLTLPPGDYTLALSVPSYEDWTREVELLAGQELPVDASLTPLPPLKTLEIGAARIGKDAYLDPTGTIRLGTSADSFTVADEINAIVYLKPSSYKIRDLSFKATTRWQRPGQPQPLVLQGDQQVSRDWEETFVRACAPAAAIDPGGSNTPLRLEILIDDQVVAQFTFRIGPGSPPPAGGRPCATDNLPSRVAARGELRG